MDPVLWEHKGGDIGVVRVSLREQHERKITVRCLAGV